MDADVGVAAADAIFATDGDAGTAGECETDGERDRANASSAVPVAPLAIELVRDCPGDTTSCNAPPLVPTPAAPPRNCAA